MTKQHKKFLIKGSCFFFFVMLLILITNNFAWAAEGTGASTNVFNTFQNTLTGGKLSSSLQEYGKRLFGLLVAAQITWNLTKLILDGKFDIQALFLMFIREIIVVGVFYYLATNGVTLLSKVINGFKNEGMNLAGLGGDFSPLLVVSKGFELITTMWSTATEDKGSLKTLLIAFQLAIPTVFILYAFVQIAMVAAVTYIRALVSASILVYFLGFGGSDYTRDIAVASIKTVFMQAVELFTVIVIVGIINTVIPELINNMTASNAESWFRCGIEIAFASFIMQGLISSLPSMISGVLTGTAQSSGGANAAMGQQLASLMAGAATMAGGMALTGAGAAAGKAGSFGWGKLTNAVSNVFNGNNEVTSGGSQNVDNKSDGGKGLVDFANRQEKGGGSVAYKAAKTTAGVANKAAKEAGKAVTGSVKGTGNFLQDVGQRMMRGENAGGAIAGAAGTSMQNLGYAAKGIFSKKDKGGSEDISGNSLEAGRTTPQVSQNQNNNNNERFTEGVSSNLQEVNDSSLKGSQPNVTRTVGATSTPDTGWARNTETPQEHNVNNFNAGTVSGTQEVDESLLKGSPTSTSVKHEQESVSGGNATSRVQSTNVTTQDTGNSTDTSKTQGSNNNFNEGATSNSHEVDESSLKGSQPNVSHTERATSTPDTGFSRNTETPQRNNVNNFNAGASSGTQEVDESLLKGSPTRKSATQEQENVSSGNTTGRVQSTNVTTQDTGNSTDTGEKQGSDNKNFSEGATNNSHDVDDSLLKGTQPNVSHTEGATSTPDTGFSRNTETPQRNNVNNFNAGASSGTQEVDESLLKGSPTRKNVTHEQESVSGGGVTNQGQHNNVTTQDTGNLSDTGKTQGSDNKNFSEGVANNSHEVDESSLKGSPTNTNVTHEQESVSGGGVTNQGQHNNVTTQDTGNLSDTGKTQGSDNKNFSEGAASNSHDVDESLLKESPTHTKNKNEDVAHENQQEATDQRLKSDIKQAEATAQRAEVAAQQAKNEQHSTLESTETTTKTTTRTETTEKIEKEGTTETTEK